MPGSSHIADKTQRLSRRGFLKLLGINAAAAALPSSLFEDGGVSAEWPRLEMDALPRTVQNVLAKTPDLYLAPDGYLRLMDGHGRLLGKVLHQPTIWNQEHQASYDKLFRHLPWGIVLHWYGDRGNYDGSLKSYMRGFNSLRPIGNIIGRTSAHFLVGEGHTSASINPKGAAFGIVQTQSPAPDGVPYIASHIQDPDLEAHMQKKQYFVRALYTLGFQEPGVHSLLQDFYDGPYVDPNYRTIAIEIAGYDFDHPEHAPSDQKIANVLALVWQLMKRYRILANDIMGHNEVQLGKADPGKKFLATMRYLVGVKALLEDDELMKRLVFGPFLHSGATPRQAVEKYFKFVRDYFALVSPRRSVYEWEVTSQYWPVYDRLTSNRRGLTAARQYLHPLAGKVATPGYDFLVPEDHEGVDMYDSDPARMAIVNKASPALLMADGLCLYTGEGGGHCRGRMAIFRHRQLDGAEVVTVYNHLESLGEVRSGRLYPAGHPVGQVESRGAHRQPFLHFAVAYAATWDADLHEEPQVPLNAGRTWIDQRYLNPVDYLNRQICQHNNYDNRLNLRME
jgi:hypothetical protein